MLRKVSIERVVTVGRPRVELGTRGRRLWNELHKQVTPGPAETVLIEEACRIADRLDQLDGQLRGRGEWLRLEADEDRDELVMVVDRGLAEARQQAATLKSLIAEIRQAGLKAAAPKGPVSRRDQLAAQRTKRLAGSQG